MYMNQDNVEGLPMREISVDITTGIVKLPLEAPLKKSIAQNVRDHLRHSWSGRLDFLMSCIGFSVGLGNIWRFPYLCYKSGGGAFLIPYTFFMITCSIPLFFLEFACGQFASVGIITVWRISPLFQGVGYGMIIISSLVCIYYNVIMAWTFYFLLKSMSVVLPWSLCQQSWNTRRCLVLQPRSNLTQQQNGTNMVPASVEFWERNVLEMTDGIEDFGSIRWPLFGCLFLAWVVVFLCLFKGIKSSGKIVYVTATFPYCVLVMLLVRVVTLHGAKDGIKYYMIPKWHKLIDLQVWGEAAVQIFYSMGMACGTFINMASYNKFHHDIYKDAIAVPLVSGVTSVFAGFVTFSTLGFMSHESGVPIEKVVAQGPGLTFVAYPEAVSRMPFAQFWAVMFFLMIFTVGLDSQFGFFEMITAAFIDEYPDVLRKHRTLFTAVACVIAFFLGVPLIFQGGIYLLEIIDWYAATFSLMFISVIECLVICWVYGVQRFAKDIELMLGRSPSLVWVIMWKYVTPIIVMYISSFSLGTLEPANIKSHTSPRWVIFFGWSLAAASLVPLPVVAYIGILREKTGTIIQDRRIFSTPQRVKKLAQPAYNWGPAHVENKIKYFKSMDKFEKERFEAAYFDLDRDRYLSRRHVDTRDMTVSINVDPAYPVTQYILPLEVVTYFPVLSHWHEDVVV